MFTPTGLHQPVRGRLTTARTLLLYPSARQHDAMASDSHTTSRVCRPEQRYRDQLRCLPRGLMPMPDDDTARTAEKAVALLLVTAWTAGTLAMTLTSIETTVPPHWPYFTALVFLLVGKLWDLEVQKYLPGGTD